MFTGLVETTGALAAREPRGPGFRLEIASELGPLELGESIAVSGACLTVAEIGEGRFFADVSLETVQKTTLGKVAIGSQLNLERSLRVGDRLGGHWVTGHVDALARVVSTEAVGDALRVVVAVPEPLLAFVAAKGSVALDGVSLTVNAVVGDRIELMLIPHTLALTNLKALAPGSELNLEIDLVARYVVRYLEASDAARR
jgi:riboflavin synthase